MTINGTTGNNHKTGTAGADDFDMSQGGKDTVDGLAGNDTIYFGAELTAKDTIDGGDDFDSLTLDGDYSGGLRFKAATMVNVDFLNVLGGFSYDLTLADANTSGTFGLAASGLGAGDRLVFDASRDTDTTFVVSGGAGNDVIHGSDFGNSFIDSIGGGDDVTGGAGSDEFRLYQTLSSDDSIDGGGGTDFVELEGDYSAGLTISSSMIRGIEVMTLADGFDYDLTFGKHVHESHIYVNALALSSGPSVSFDAHNAKDYETTFAGGAGDDNFVGGALTDDIQLDAGGDDTADGRDGDDIFEMGAAFNPRDRIDGGDGYDTVYLNGSDFGDITFRPSTMKHVEEIDLLAGRTYVLIFDDETVGAGKTLLVDGSLLQVGESLSLEGQNETNGTFIGIGGANNDVMEGGAGDDTMSGNAGNDHFYGGLGADTLNGAGGEDFFSYYTIEESTGTGHDVLGSFNTNADIIGVTTTVNDVDPTIHGGTLSVGTFDDDLSFAVDGNALHGSNAVIFRPDQGDLAGHIFLVIEFNGGDGYQAGQDWVIEIVSGTNLGALSASNFVHIFP